MVLRYGLPPVNLVPGYLELSWEAAPSCAPESEERLLNLPVELPTRVGESEDFLGVVGENSLPGVSGTEAVTEVNTAARVDRGGHGQALGVGERSYRGPAGPTFVSHAVRNRLSSFFGRPHERMPVDLTRAPHSYSSAIAPVVVNDNTQAFHLLGH